jgi:acetyl-CoA C-acetyltransferase
MSEVRRVAIVGGSRIPFCRSVTKYAKIGNFEMMTGALKGLVDKFDLSNKKIDEVILGAVLKRSKDFSMARETLIQAGLDPSTVGIDIQQACGTSLQAAFMIANKIALGQIEAGIAAGCDTSSDVPIELSKNLSDTLVGLSKARTMGQRLGLIGSLRPKDIVPKLPAIKEPRTNLSMGDHCELMAQQWQIPREEQDQLAFNSHQNAAKAYEEGFMDDLVCEFQGVKVDNNMRADTSLEKLAKLRPAFERSEKGTLTAANSTPLTDGAAATLLCSEEYAKENGLEILAYLTFTQTAAVDFINDEGLLMAPAYAVPRMLQRAGVSLQDFDFYEIHEAFAAQVLCTLKAWESEDFCKNKLGLDKALGSIDISKLNIKGGSLAVGHPFAATGARILAQAAKLVHQNNGGRTLISICTAGGMGVSAIVER